MRLATKKILQNHRPQLVFICKTKLESRQVNEECRRFKLGNCFTVSRKGKSGGIAMMWTSNISMNIVSYGRHPEVQYGNGKTWWCIGVYGHPYTQQKKHTWTSLRRLVGLSSKPWLCSGDFSEILNLNEKPDGNYRNVQMIYEFREVIQASNFVDLGCKVYLFAWNNVRFGPHYVEERLDKFFVIKNGGITFRSKLPQI